MFKDAGVDGTLVIESVNNGQRFVHNDLRSKQAFTVASTFKIFHTLIALNEGVVRNAESTFRWDGTSYDIADWNHDQTFASAFKVSCVWCYQQLAIKIGAERYPEYIQTADYGLLQKPFNVSQFWLDGSLIISAEQQIAFLKEIVNRSLAFDDSSYDTLKSIMLSDSEMGFHIYSKTGWATSCKPNIGWYVGYVETNDETWVFALNLDTRSPSDLSLRKQITLNALRMKGILPVN